MKFDKSKADGEFKAWSYTAKEINDMTKQSIEQAEYLRFKNILIYIQKAALAEKFRIRLFAEDLGTTTLEMLENIENLNKLGYTTDISYEVETEETAGVKHIKKSDKIISCNISWFV